MPKQSLEQLYREIKQEGSAVQGYEAFLDAMEALNAELHALMEPDATGWKLMDGPRTEKLAALYRNAGIALEQLLANSREAQVPADHPQQQKLRLLAELQRRGKRPEDDSYVHERIKAAQSISQYAVKQQTISPEEQEFLASNQRRALEQNTRANLKNPQNEPQAQDKSQVITNNLIQP